MNAVAKFAITTCFDHQNHSSPPPPSTVQWGIKCAPASRDGGPLQDSKPSGGSLLPHLK